MTWLDVFLARRSKPDQEDRSSIWDSTLEALCAGLPPEDAQDLREERAAILEYETGLPRDEAERRAGITLRRAAA